MPFSPINFTSDGPPINGAYFLTIECNVTQGDAARKVQEWPAQTGSPLTTLEIPSDCRRDDGDALRESGFDRCKTSRNIHNDTLRIAKQITRSVNKDL